MIMSSEPQQICRILLIRKRGISMKSITARKISNNVFYTAIILGYVFFLSEAISILLSYTSLNPDSYIGLVKFVDSAQGYISIIQIILLIFYIIFCLIFLRCPHCKRLLNINSHSQSVCHNCGERLMPMDESLRNS